MKSEVLPVSENIHDQMIAKLEKLLTNITIEKSAEETYVIGSSMTRPSKDTSYYKQNKTFTKASVANIRKSSLHTHRRSIQFPMKNYENGFDRFPDIYKPRVSTLLKKFEEEISDKKVGPSKIPTRIKRENQANGQALSNASSEPKSEDYGIFQEIQEKSIVTRKSLGYEKKKFRSPLNETFVIEKAQPRNLIRSYSTLDENRGLNGQFYQCMMRNFPISTRRVQKVAPIQKRNVRLQTNSTIENEDAKVEDFSADSLQEKKVRSYQNFIGLEVPEKKNLETTFDSLPPVGTYEDFVARLKGKNLKKF